MFREALAHIIARLDEAQTRGLVTAYALIGGHAVSAWGVPRGTRDLDFAIAVGSTEPSSLAAFVGGTYQAGEPDDPLRGVIRAFAGLEGERIPLQLVILSPDLTAMIFKNMEVLTLRGCRVQVANWQALVILKLYAGGPPDLLDAEQIMTVQHPSSQQLTTLSEMAEQVGLSKDWKGSSSGFGGASPYGALAACARNVLAASLG